MRSWTVIAGAVAVLAGLLSVAPASAAPEVDGTTEPRVVGGEPTTSTDYPWMVALLDGSGQQYCGGSLIAPARVVTAAHCVQDRNPASLTAVAGRTDLRTNEGSVAGVTWIWTHPGFTDSLQGDDVAVLGLDRSLPNRTIPLETDQGAYWPGRMATVLGWGYTSEDGGPSPTLRRADLPLVSDADCRAAHPDYQPESMVCAGYPDGGVDACFGDSGGPLVAGGRLIGIISWGVGCARPGSPGVYVRVASYAGMLSEQTM